VLVLLRISGEFLNSHWSQQWSALQIDKKTNL